MESCLFKGQELLASAELLLLVWERKNVRYEVTDPWFMLCMNTLDRKTSNEHTEHPSTESELSAPSARSVTVRWLLPPVADLHLQTELHWGS